MHIKFQFQIIIHDNIPTVNFSEREQIHRANGIHEKGFDKMGTTNWLNNNHPKSKQSETNTHSKMLLVGDSNNNL